MIDIANYIDGELVVPLEGNYLDNFEPATGKVYSRVPDSSEHDVDQAVAAAARAFPAWSHTPAAERSRVMLKLADLVEAHFEELVRAESIDNGKPVRLARAVDLPRTAANIRYFGSAMLHFQSESHTTDHAAINYTLRRPRGVAGIISPWNLPLYLLTWKAAPALAMGCTVVAKPSEVTPMTAYLFSKLCQEAGLPRGVLNIVHGRGNRAGAALVSHPNVPTISFTGGTVTGAEIAKTAAPLFKKYSLELGGKNPNIVFEDADLDVAVPESARAAFANQGQVCLCGSRIFVQQSIYDEFVDRLVPAAKALRIGDPLDEQTEQGAMVSRPHWEKVKGCIDRAQSEGGNLRCGGRVPATLSERCKDGYFLEPTVITDLDVGCRTNQVEIFGPVTSVIPFTDERQAIEYANATAYGLSSSVWTSSVDRAHRMAEAIDSGTVWINCWMIRDLRVPFGGMKQSGVGREGGQEALRFYTEPKNVCIRVPSM